MAAALGPRASDVNVGTNDFRLPCTICCRKFVPEALDRHEKICQKTAQKQRKTFDSAKQRILGTDIPTVQSAPPLLQSLRSGRSNKNPQKRNKPKSRLYIGGNNNNGRGPPTSFMNRLNSGFVQCPSCERNFSDKAADRHIAWCKELRSRIPRSPPCNVAKHRLDARIQYKAPMPGKRRNSPPRSPTKMCTPGIDASIRPAVKSPLSPVVDTQGVMGVAIQARQRRGNNDIKSSKSSNQGSQSNLSSNGMIHSSSWEYFDEPVKTGNMQRSTAIKSKQQERPKLGGNDSNYDPFESAQRQMEELLLSSSSGSPVLAVKSAMPSTSKNRSTTSEEQVHSNGSSAWSLESDKDLEDIEEDIVVFDDPIFEEIIAMQATPIPLSQTSSRHPRRPVSREEALFGNKVNTTASLDSDYGSLLRRSPSTPVRLSINPGSLIIGSSCSSRSSSETSLPRLITGDTVTSDGSVKMSRFCHECGTKYPVTGAKFCCECGIRRLCI